MRNKTSGAFELILFFYSTHQSSKFTTCRPKPVLKITKLTNNIKSIHITVSDMYYNNRKHFNTVLGAENQCCQSKSHSIWNMNIYGFAPSQIRHTHGGLHERTEQTKRKSWTRRNAEKMRGRERRREKKRENKSKYQWKYHRCVNQLCLKISYWWKFGKAMPNAVILLRINEQLRLLKIKKSRTRNAVNKM